MKTRVNLLMRRRNMKNILILCQNTGQTFAFKRTLLSHTWLDDKMVNFFFEDQNHYLEVLSNQSIDLVLISPEVLLYEKQIVESLKNNKIQYIHIKPIDYGLRRVEKIFDTIAKIINF